MVMSDDRVSNIGVQVQRVNVRIVHANCSQFRTVTSKISSCHEMSGLRVQFCSRIDVGVAEGLHAPVPQWKTGPWTFCV